jgi:hypothetical protein
VNLRKTLLVSALLFGSCTQASAITAVCQNAKGRIFGVHGVTLGRKSFDEPDAISKATFTVLWTAGDKSARIVTQSTGGKNPVAEDAIVVNVTEEQITFLVLYDSAVWLYSFYPKPKVLILTSHNNGVSVDAGGAVVKSYLAQCEVGE